MSTAPTLTIQTDRGPLVLPAPATLADALAHLLSPTQSADTVATAVNGLFVPRQARATHALANGDTVLCFSPITGG